HVALLRFVAPELHRAHAGLVARDRAQIDYGAALGELDDLGHGVREAARADVVDGDDRIRGALRGAAVDDLLRAPLHLGVAALHGREVELRLALPRTLRRRGAAAQADQHRGAAEHDELVAGRGLALLDVDAAHVAQAARDHDRLVT